MRAGAWPNNLPAKLTSFIGRGREREELRAALASTRLLVLTGAGGAGKTRLALQAAADISDSFPDGGWWVELAPLGEGEPLGVALAGVLGVRPLPGRTPLQAAVDRLADDRALVVLDNCEQVLVAAAELVEALLRGCPRLVVLATSREPLGVPGESDWRVPSLSLPDTDEPRVVARSDAGALFAERAAKVRPEFVLGDRTAASVARICRELDGIPLAIELAAARVRMLSVEQITAGLSDRFRLLTGGPREVVARQQTLRASVDWSYELLSDEERVLFRRLAVLVGSWSLEAVESVAAGGGLEGGAILDLLASLVDKSLVAVEEHGRAARYLLLETVRQYAVERLEQSGEMPVLRDRHLECFLALAERAAQELEIPRNWGWLDLLEPDAANFDAAIDHGVEKDPERALRICVGLTTWWKMSGRFAAGQNALDRALDAADPSPRPLRARALWSCGHLVRFRGDRSAVRYAQEALEMAESISDESTMARALHTLGALRMFEDPVASRAAFARGLELARDCGDEWLVMSLLTALARSYLVTDDYDDAERVFGEAQPMIERVGVEGVTWSAVGLAMCAMVRAENERCLGLCERALSAARELGDPVTEAYAHALLARIENMEGRASAALARSLESETRVIANGAAMALPWTRLEQASAYAALGRLDRAHELLEVVVAGGADSDWMLCEGLLALGDVLRVLGDADGARARACEALELSERLGARSLSALGRELLARLAIGRDEWSEAKALLHAALAQHVELGGRVWLPQTLDALAQVAAGLESFTEAARLLGAVDRARSDVGLVRWSPDAPAFDRLEELLAEQLGSEGFAGARAEGAVMSLDEAIGWMRRARGTRKRPTGGWESLTPTERQVVEFVSEGLTNPEVAERMFISRATVKVHLAHIFQKLDVSSRSELTALAVRRAG